MNNIFDIRRFSLEDGEGIRTVIFFKGCPLRCQWCHNPESFKFEQQLKYMKEKCINCKKCLICPNKVHSFDEKHNVDFTKCNACGLCTSCDALKIIGEKLDVKKVVEEVLKDKGYYDKTNGGVTISGGEAMANFDGLTELVKAIKSHNINISLETSGQASLEKFNQILPYIDTFLYDYKHSDKEQLKYFTKGNLILIESNLEFLLKSNKEVILRCPLIDDVNLTKDHLNKINEYANDSRIKRIEILPYHSFGEIKYDQLNSGTKKYSYENLTKGEVITKINNLIVLNKKILIK